jgi:ribosomal protein S18 acetylase RimI-like enzyme
MNNQRQRPRTGERVRVRPYRTGDFEFVRRLFSEYTNHEKRRLAKKGLVYSWDFDERYLKSLPRQTRRGGVFLVATVGDRSAGWIAAIRKGKKENWSWDATTRPSGLVMELHVASEFRGRGIGRQLMETVEKHFRSRGSDWLSLGLFPANEGARRFYDRLGYQPVYTYMGKRPRAT